jgi:hypothetical protein
MWIGPTGGHRVIRGARSLYHETGPPDYRKLLQKIRQRMSGRRCHRLRLSRWIDYDISRDHSTDKFMSWWMRATT